MRTKSLLACVTVLTLALTLAGCSTIDRTHSVEANAQTPEAELRQQIQELRKELTQANIRVESLETRIATLSDQLKAASVTRQMTAPQTASGEKKSIEAVQGGAADELEEIPPAASSTGYTNDEATLNYRQALLLFKAKKYPEAILAFSTFVERYPDHPLAGNAQYYVGHSYLQQGEPKLALQELQRVLSIYDRSPMITRALLDMALAEEKLQNREAAAKYRQLLISLFPMSPAAGELRQAAQKAEAPAPVSPLGAPPPETAPINIPNDEGERE